MQQSIKLTYFEAAGRAEPVRLIFNHAGIQFEDERLPREEFAKQKEAGTFKYGQLPVLTVDGVQYAQSGAITRFAALKAGLLPTNPIDLLKAEQLSGNIEDIFAKTFPTFGLQGEEQKKAREELVATVYPKWFGAIEKDLVQNGANGFVAGNQLSFADFLVFQLVGMFQSGMLDHIPTTVTDSYPNINKVAATVKNNEKVQQWYAQHPPKK